MTAASSDAVPEKLQWSARLRVLPEAETPQLKGDRIVLPQSALEQLLAAATTVTYGEGQSQPAFDPFNPHTFTAERQARQQTIERQQNLPHPLHFRIVNPVNGNILYSGIREFSAPEGAVGISSFVRSSLGVVDSDDEAQQAGTEISLTIHLQTLPKGSFVKFRPLESGYDVEDWKAFLEQHLRDNYTSLTSGEEIAIKTGNECFRFLVDELRPGKDAISLIDTDLEVDIEPLSEEQARENLQKLSAKSQKRGWNQEGTAAGGKLGIDTPVDGRVQTPGYVDYVIESWDRNQHLEIALLRHGDEGDIDLFVTPFGPRQRSKPREDNHTLHNVNSSAQKSVRIARSNVAFEDAEAIFVSVRAWPYESDHSVEGGKAISFTLQVTTSDTESAEAEEMDSVVLDGEERCTNCQQSVPKRTMFLHQNYCFRNNAYCPRCHNVFLKTSDEWKSHWHCPRDDSFGNDTTSKQKHDDLSHTPRVCPACNYDAVNILDLAFHRATSCPSKLILCQFCHLQVPQKSENDPDLESAEVLLSGLTPHEVSDGARTTECHLCSRIVRLRDMAAHLKHHDMQRLSRIAPRTCKNANCGRTVDQVSRTGDLTLKMPNDIGLCETCFGPLYNSQYDPDGKALKRRLERKYLTQLLTGCKQDWCRNDLCKTGRNNLSGGSSGGLASKEASSLIKPLLDAIKDPGQPIFICTDQASQVRRTMAEMLAAEGTDSEGKGKGKEKTGLVPGHGYELPWCIAGLDVEAGNLEKARVWLHNFAPRRDEVKR